MPFIYPTAFELRTIQSDYIASDRANRLGLQILPVQNVAAPKVRWNQQDTYAGLQHLRGLDGRPTRVNRVGWNTYEYEPGYFGEYIDITETELNNRAPQGVDLATTNIDVSDIINEADRQLIQREDDRIESTIWTLLTTGTISITLDGPDGTQIGFQDTYTFQSYTAPITWATSATATPLRDFQAIQQLGPAAGKSANFGTGAKAYANTVTLNRLLNNANASDFSGRRTSFGATLNNLGNFNSYLASQGLPELTAYDGGYWTKRPADVGAAFKKFIPDGTVVVVGQRPGNVPVGNYLMTRNVVNGFRPGSYRKLIDRVNGRNAEERVPPNIEIHRGHNGGVAIYYPSSVITMFV